MTPIRSWDRRGRRKTSQPSHSRWTANGGRTTASTSHRHAYQTDQEVSQVGPGDQEYNKTGQPLPSTVQCPLIRPVSKNMTSAPLPTEGLPRPRPPVDVRHPPDSVMRERVDLGRQSRCSTRPVRCGAAGASVASGSQWQLKNSLTVPFGRTLKCSLTWFLNVDPSDPVPRTLKVNVPSTTLPLSLKPPQTVNLPV